MRYNLTELIDVEKTQRLLQNFYGAVGIPAAIIDLEGAVFVTSSWQRVCTDFHRVNQTTRGRCIESDTVLANELLEGKAFSLYRCRNGLTDAASPVIIEGEHVANAFIGQFFIEKPDMGVFRRQAGEFGFDESAYLEAVSEVPIVASDTLPSILSFLTSFAEMIASLGLKQLARLETEEELRNAKQQWERTFDSVPDLIAILDDRHRIIRANREMARRLGTTPEKVVGLRCYESIHCSLRPHKSCPHSQTLRDGREHIAEVHEERLGGSFIVSTTPLRDEHGTILGTVHVARDITERKRMEEELRKSHNELELRVRERTAELARAVARLELMNQELQDFAKVASHDLQEPLRKIQAFGDRLRNKCRDKLDETEKDYLTRMEGAANRMQQLIRDLLILSRVGTRPEPLRPIDLNEIAGEVVQIFEHCMRSISGAVEISQLPTIDADATQMKQLFQNLISNALKFQSDGETPHVKVYSASKDNNTCLISFEDNGIGFEEKYLDRIFAPFQRLHGRCGYEGTGMGLAICRKIVERHGGSITAKSRPGKGSTFIVTLPVRQKTEEAV